MFEVDLISTAAIMVLCKEWSCARSAWSCARSGTVQGVHGPVQGVVLQGIASNPLILLGLAAFGSVFAAYELNTNEYQAVNFFLTEMSGQNMTKRFGSVDFPVQELENENGNFIIPLLKMNSILAAIYNICHME